MTFYEANPIADEDLCALVFIDIGRKYLSGEPGEIYAVGTLDTLLGGGISVPWSPGYWDRSGAEPVFVREPRDLVDIRSATQAEYKAYCDSIDREQADQRACSWAM